MLTAARPELGNAKVNDRFSAGGFESEKFRKGKLRHEIKCVTSFWRHEFPSIVQDK